MGIDAPTNCDCFRTSGISLSDRRVHVFNLVGLFQLRKEKPFMNPDIPSKKPSRIGRWVSFGIVACALVLGLVVRQRTVNEPRTDDATVLANYIWIAPQVEGPLIHLNVHDNQLVRQGEPLFEIDDRPYQYALENALSEQAALEGQI